jgi:predicted acetyltransferase
MTADVRAPRTDDELRACYRVGARGFNAPLTTEAEDEFLASVHRDRVLAVFDAASGEVAAYAQVRPFGQFFGGRSVAMGGFSPVVTAPEFRGHGHGSLVTSAHYPSMRERGEVIASLYPAQTQLYRGVGFELGGVYASRRLPTRSLHKLRPAGEVAIRRASADDLDGIKACYRRFAQTQEGWVDRPDVWWERLLPAAKLGVSQHVYVVDGASGIDAYIRYTQKAKTPFGYDIDVAELCSTDLSSTIALWRLVGSSSTQAEFTLVTGPTEHPLLLLLADQDLRTAPEIRWMTRVVDAAGAIAQRGFDEGVSCTVDLDLADRQCDWNHGLWRLTVEGGKGELAKGGDGGVSLSVNALSALFTGYASATILRQTGSISRGEAGALAKLTAAFAGPTPSIADFF